MTDGREQRATTWSARRAHLEALAERASAAVKRHKTLSWTGAAIVIGGVALDQVKGGVVTAAGLWLLQGIPKLWALPLGPVVSLFLVVVLVLLVVSILAVRPPRQDVVALRGELAALAAERDEQRERIDSLIDEVHTWQWRRQFHRDPPSLNDDAPIVGTVSEAEMLRLATATKALGKAVAAVCNDLEQHYTTGNFGSGLWMAGAYFSQEFAQPTRRALGLLASPGPEDVRLAFMTAWDMYRDLRAWIPRVATAQGRTLAELRGYDEWRTADAEFLAEARRIPELPGLREVRQLVHQSGNHSSTAPLPDRGTIVARGTFTNEEQQFLNLFDQAWVTRERTRPNTHLDGAIYAAGLQLVQRGLLLQSDVDASTRRFCLSPVIRSTWQTLGREMEPARECIELDLHTVRGTQATGGGAAGIHAT